MDGFDAFDFYVNKIIKLMLKMKYKKSHFES